jgi:V8-like Glu-specific endopeptidase
MTTTPEKVDAPVTARSLRRRREEEATEAPPGGEFSLYEFALPDGDDVELVRDERGTYRVVARTRGDGVRVEPPYPTLEVQKLDRGLVEQLGDVRELDGYRPPFAALRSWPHVLERAGRLGEDEDRPANVFQPDSRYVYQDTSFPWRIVGRVWGAGGTGSGAVVGPRHVLTASHMIDWHDDGGAGWVTFSPGYFNTNGPWGEYHATSILSWNKAEGGLTDLETAFDYVVLVMDRPVGDHVGYAGYRAYDDGWNGGAYWQHMGYPGDLTGTQRPAFVGSAVVSSTSDESVSGQDGLVMGHFNDITGGHSGGPVWGWWGSEPWPRVVGVQSAEAGTPGPTTSGDNEFGGGSALSALISYARSNFP